MRSKPGARPPDSRSARLAYVSDQTPGISRDGEPGAFTYQWPTGRVVRRASDLARIGSLAIPPAWTEVWISTNPRGHIQATGRDARGRKQYRYHSRWTSTRDAAKFERLLDFARVLPAIRDAVVRDLREPPNSRQRVLAVVVSLLERTHIRIGNDEYARTNNSYGLTTLRDHHARVRGRRVAFTFRGKSGVLHDVTIDDPALARDVRRCQELPGQTLFAYRDEEGVARPIDSADVNRYLGDVTGGPFTAKDFRTWWGTVSAAARLRDAPKPSTKVEATREIVRALDVVAAELRNTRAVCRKCYVHPEVLSAYRNGQLARADEQTGSPVDGLTADEAWTVAVLERLSSKRRRSPVARFAA